MDTLNWFIRERKDELGLSCRQIGEKMGLSTRAVIGWVTGDTMPRSGDIPQLCNVLQCDPNYLFGWEDKACSR